MKLYILIDVNGKPHLREKNPLAGLLVISEAAYREHERLYIDSALPFPDPVADRVVYAEDELRVQWRYRERVNTPWINVSEPAFVDSKPDQYQQIFVLINPESYQDRVKQWVSECFGSEYAVNVQERALRYLEESLELVQALGIHKDQALKQLVWTYGCEPGEINQEFGGVMVTLAALAAAVGVDAKTLGEIQINENIANSEKIKAKHQLKIKQGIAL